MPLISNHLRLLFSPSSLFLSPLKPSFSLRKPNFLSSFTILSSSSRKPRNTPQPYTNRRKITTFKETTIQEKKGLLMEENNNDSAVGFNKKRAEGNDKSVKFQNLQLKVRKLNPVNTICYVQILGTGLDTQDTSPSILLFFDKQRFIFNAGEGLQRFCTEHKIKLSKIDHIFLSRVCSETAGGLPGLLLTLAGMGDEGMSVNIWGPSDFKYLLDAMKSFIPRAAMVHTHSFGSSPSSDEVPIPDPGKLTVPIALIDDEVIKLSAILLRPSCSSESQLNQECILLHPPKEKPGDLSVIYICELPEIKGKFDPKKAADLGLRAGSKYRELQLGNAVMTDSQNALVKPSDVMGPSIPGPIVFVVDCPTESHLEELLSLESLSDYYADSSIKPLEGIKVVNCIIHLSPGHVTATTNYQKWMKRFGAAQHVMAGHERKNVEIPILKASARIAARLNYLCPQFFPAPGFWSMDHLNNPAPDSFASSEVSKLCESISAQNLLKFHLRPYSQLGLDRSHIPPLSSPSEIIDELHSEIPEIVDAAQQVSQLWQNVGETKEKTPVQDSEVMTEEPWLDGNILPSCLENITREDMEIVLLGTGSSQPSKYRNVSSIYINLFAKGGLLLDCGEGSLGQLIRRYGVDGADDVVRSLNCIWISHIHADHHTGLARILARRRQLLKNLPHKPLLVIGPRQLKRYLDAYQRLENLDMLFLDCKETMEASEDDGQNTTLFTKGSRMQSYRKRPRSPGEKDVIASILENMKKMLSEAGLEALVSFSVVHCPEAFGVSILAAERVNSVGKVIPGWKIVYSGDTRPCPELIKASHGATVLIHEATFEDGLVEEAIARNHSTTKEAIEVGESAGVYRIILTHFSQRYPKIPVFDGAHMHKTCIAFDMMSINMADLPVLPKVLPYLKLLFKNEMIVDDSDMIADELDDISASAAAT